MLKSLRDLYLRIDARSLGLFRWAMGAVLIFDLFRRWSWLRDFYSNEGVLPNHNHIFNLPAGSTVWSALHAFSSPGENHFAFGVILLFYVLFTIGHKTRAFHVLTLVSFVSLTARDILIEGSGNYLVLGLLAFTLFLPLGKAMSLDSVRASFEARDEHDDHALNDRPTPREDDINASRGPGWSPVSIAAFATIAQLAIVLYCSARQHESAMWKDGTAFYYAVHNERLVSTIGASLRGAAGLLSALTRFVHYGEYAAAVLIFVPGAPRITRAIAGLLVFTIGLTYALLFSLGAYGWALMASGALLIPRESWEAWSKPTAKLARRVVYDADCGICLVISRLLVRCDYGHNLTFIGNDKIGVEGGPALPAEVTSALADSSVIVVDANGKVFTRGHAVAAIVRALPLGVVFGTILGLPGVVHLLNVVYDVIATRRIRISVAIGKEACGIPQRATEGEVEEAATVAPATKVVRTFTGGAREIGALVVFVAMLGQTAAMNPFPRVVPQNKVLAGIATWPRMMARWNVLADISQDDEMFVIDAQTKGGRSIDPFTGQAPSFDLSERKGSHLGQLWNDYLGKIHQKEWEAFQKALRDYLVRGGPKWDGSQPDNSIVGYDAYWVKQRIALPGEAPSAPQKDKLFTHMRGGKLQIDSAAPILRPGLITPR